MLIKVMCYQFMLVFKSKTWYWWMSEEPERVWIVTAFLEALWWYVTKAFYPGIPLLIIDSRKIIDLFIAFQNYLEGEKLETI